VETDYRVPFTTAAKLVAQACEGLHHAHEFRDPETSAWLGVVHRDVSPENILVSRFGAVKVVDFGIAKAMKANDRTASIRGKYAYMSPEQLRGKGFDRRVDIYGLGVVLYELVTGRKPFDAVGEVATMHAILKEPIIPPRKRRPDTPAALERIIERCLEKDPAYRHETCQALQAELEEYILHSGAPVTPVHLSRLISQLGAIPRTQGGRAFPEDESARERPNNGHGKGQVTRTSFTTWMADQPTEVGSLPVAAAPYGHMVTKAEGLPVELPEDVPETNAVAARPVRRGVSSRGDPEHTVNDAPRGMSYTRIVPRPARPIRYALWKVADFFGFGRRR
jgi:serine/threonine-protein kinase